MRNRKHILWLGFAALMIFSACKKKMTQFDIDYSAVLKTPVVSRDLVSVSTEEMKTDCRIKFERNDTKRSKVKKIFLKSLAFSADSQKSEIYYLKHLKHIYISCPNFAEQEISFKKLNEHNTGDDFTVEVSGSGHNLLEVIKEDRFSMRFEFERTKDFPEFIRMYTRIVFFVEGELIKTNLYHKILV